MLKIALAGTARSGKDTFANVLERELNSQGYDVVKVAFADYLKDLYEQLFSYIPTNEKPRDAYITIGNAFREIDPNFWIRPIEIISHTLEEHGGNYGIAEEASTKDLALIITDTRYYNEALWAEQEGYYIVKVDADPLIRQQRSEALGETLKLDNEGDLQVEIIQPHMTVWNNGEQDFKDMPLTAKAVVTEAQNLN